jgi:hypothetical protein
MTYIKKTGFLILLLISFCTTQAQRLNTGLTYDFYGIHPTRFPSDILFSESSYKAFYIKKFQVPHDMQANFALNLLVDYSRFFINARFGINSTNLGSIYKYSYPIGGNGFKDYYSKIQYQQTDISCSFGYFINYQKFMRPYVETGVGRSAPYFYLEEVSDVKSFTSTYPGRIEMKDYLDLGKSYTYVLIGFGYRGDLFALSARYRIRVGNYDVFYSNLSLGMSVFTKFSKLRKHYIYQPEE